MKRQLAALLLTIFALSLTACGETAAESETRINCWNMIKSS